jgi:hypothetical protein
MQKHNGIAYPDVDMGHLRAEHLGVLPVGNLFRGNGGM